MSEPKEYGTLISPKSALGEPSDAPERRPAELYAVGGLPKGELVAARFEVLLLADSGAMADVYRARDGATGELVALKVLRSEAATVERFEREAAALGLLTHPGVPRLVATGRLGSGQPFLAMEWVEGVTLDRFLKRERPGPRTALEIVISIADVLAAAHAGGVIHRDLNPANVMVQPRGVELTDEVVSTSRGGAPPSVARKIKLLDFGVAHHRASDLGITREGTQIGTPGYMAPEQVEGSRTLTPAADVFALGCVLYELLTGERPFDAPTLAGIFARILRDKPARLREFDAALPEELDRLVLRLLDKDPLRRPQDGAEALALLRELPALPEISRGALTPTSERAPQRGVGTVVLVGATDERRFTEIDTVAQRHGARAEQLQEGGVAVTILGDNVADDAAHAAAFALELRSQVRVTVIAMATGLVTAGGGATAGRALDAALVLLLLRGEVDESGSLILLAETTAHLLDASFEVRRRGAGFVLSNHEPRREGFRSFHGTRAEFVGRSRELAVLGAAHAQSREDRTAVVTLVTGPAGIGKSRLGYEFALAARRAASGVVVLRASAAPRYAGQRHALVVSLLERAMLAEPSDSRSTRRARLRERLAASLVEPRLTHVLGALDRVFDLEPMVADAPSSDPRRSSRERGTRGPTGPDLREPLLEWLRSELTRSSIVLVVDDLHRADAETVDLLDDLLRPLASEPLFALLLGRPEVAERASALFSHRGFTALKLGAISPRAASGAVEALARGRLEAPEIERIVARSRGLPLWLEHLAEAALEGQLQETPERILLLAQSELLRLEPDARRVLEAVSVLGLHFWSGAARHLIGHGALGRPFDVVKRQLLESGLVHVRPVSRFEAEEELEFASASLRDAAYALLGESSREELHGRAADWLTEQGESDPLPVAMHYTLGGQLDLARKHYLRAAQEAMTRYDDDAVITASEEALSHGPSRSEEVLEIRLLFATALYHRGDPRAALPTLQPVLDRTEPGAPLWCRAVKLQSHLSRETCRPELATDLAQRLLELPDLGHPALERTVARVAADLAALGRTSLSVGLLDALGRRRQRLHPTSRALADTLEARARLLVAEGRTLSGANLLGDAITAALESGDERSAARLEREQATWYLEIGDPVLAEEALGRARERARHVRLVVEESLHELLLLRARLGEGSPDEAAARAVDLAGGFDAAKAPRARAEAHLLAAEVCAYHQHHEATQDLAEESRRGFERVPEARAAAALWVLGLREAGDARVAAEVAKNHLRQPDAGRATRGSAWVTLAEACLELDAGDESSARQRIERALRAALEERGAGAPLHPALAVAGAWLHREGPLDFTRSERVEQAPSHLAAISSSNYARGEPLSVTERAIARLAALGLELRPVVDQDEPTLPIYLAEVLSASLRRLDQGGGGTTLGLRPGPVGRWLGVEGPLTAAAGRVIAGALRRLLERTAEQCLIEIAWIESWALDRRRGRTTDAPEGLEHWDEARRAEDPERAAEHVRAGNRVLAAAIVRRMTSLRGWLGRDLSRDVRKRVTRKREQPLRRLVFGAYLRLDRHWRRAVAREWRTLAGELLSLGNLSSLPPSDRTGRLAAFDRAARLRAPPPQSSGDRPTESRPGGSKRSGGRRGKSSRPPGT